MFLLTFQSLLPLSSAWEAGTDGGIRKSWRRHKERKKSRLTAAGWVGL